MKKTLILIISIITLSCTSQKNKKAAKSYEIANSVYLKLNPNDSIKVHELRFKPSYSATDLQKFLYNNFGKWDNSIQTSRGMDVLVWEKLDLIKSSGQLFTVAAGGEDKKIKHIKINGKQNYFPIYYCSAIVFDSNNIDCFQETAKFNELLADYFITGVRTSVKENEILFEKETKNN